jgi:iron complex outermembrane receptor protein
MRARTFNALAGSGLLAVASAAGAQTASTAGSSSAAGAGENAGFTLEEIIVTARRREESLRDVPKTIDAVTSETVEKLNILRFEDISAVVPGLSLVSGSSGYNSTASVRGVTYDVLSQTTPSVALYMNDAPMQAGFLFQSLFDVGQIEVLRGPQGTLRGESAPSGAITLATRKPDLTRFGGYASATESTSNQLDGPLASNVQGAVNLPIVTDKLAVRLAALWDNNAYDDVHSVNNPVGPYSGTKAGRVSIAFQPIDALTANVMYQHLERDLRAYQQVTGAGAPGGTGTVPGSSPPTPYPPAGYNGPVIAPDDRLAVQDGPRLVNQKFDVVTGQIELRLAGQRFTYVGSYNKQKINIQSAFDTPNLMVGHEVYGTNDTQRIESSHEFRISSEERIFGLFDYTIGGYYDLQKPLTTAVQPASYLSGAFGFPVASPFTLNSQYILPINISSGGRDEERSVFASGTVHLGERTELTVGGRRIRYRNDDSTTLALGSGLIALPPGALHLPSCAVAHFPSTLPGTCDVPVKPQVIQSQTNKVTHTPTIYEVSLSHHLNDDLMVYANTGTAWRTGPAVVGVTNGRHDPVLNSLIFLSPEYSHSYELGVKAAFLDKRALVNVAVFHQYFDGLIFQSLPAPYVTDNGATAPTISQNPFVVNANSVVNGVDADASFRLTRDWTVAGAFSYANGHVDNAPIPCTPPGFDGTVASFPAGKFVYMCNSNASVSRAPSWNTSLQSEYSMALASRADGYVRGLLTYYPRNGNASQGFVANSYALLNLYVGVRDPENLWDVSLFAKNLTNTRVTLSKDFATLSEAGNVTSTFGSSGYYATTFTAPLQVGLSVRYAVGSR